MNLIFARWFALFLFSVPAVLEFAPVVAGQSAGSIAAGGLVPRREKGIVIAKEVLRISDRKVVVDYDFRNDSHSNVTTEMEFYIPPYKNAWDTMDPAMQSFRTFSLWVDGNEMAYRTDDKATLNGDDISKTLHSRQIDIATFGHLAIGADQHFSKRRVAAPDFARLPDKEKHELLDDGIVTREGYFLYTVEVNYHWTQTFKANSTVHIRQEFVPAVGFSDIPLQYDTFQAASVPLKLRTVASAGRSATRSLELLDSFCPDAPFLKSMMRAQKAYAASWGAIVPHWVDFALTSATAWHAPIQDFTLIIEVPPHAHGEQTLVSLCSPGKTEEPDADHIQVHLTKFVPDHDLHIGFFNEPESLPPEPLAAQ